MRFHSVLGARCPGGPSGALLAFLAPRLPPPDIRSHLQRSDARGHLPALSPTKSQQSRCHTTHRAEAPEHQRRGAKPLPRQEMEEMALNGGFLCARLCFVGEQHLAGHSNVATPQHTC